MSVPANKKTVLPLEKVVDKKDKKSSDVTYTSATSKSNPAEKKRGFRPIRALVRLTFLLLILVAAAPYIIGYTPLRNFVARTALNLHGDIDMSGLSVGWFAPVSVENLEIRDAEGRPFIKIPSLSGDTAVYKLALSPTQPGKFTVEGAEVHVYLRENGSNVEDIFANWLQKTNAQPAVTPADVSKSASTPPSVGLDLRNAKVTIHDETVQQEWVFEQINVAASLDPNEPQPLLVKADCSIPLKETRGKLAIDLQAADLTGGAATPAAGEIAPSGLAPVNAAAGQNKISLQAANIPLPMFQALVRRALPNAQIAGWFQANMQGTWTGSGKSLAITLNGEADIEQLGLAAPSLHDPVSLQRIQVPCQLSLNGDRLNIQSLRVTCDVADVAVQGSATLNEQLFKDLVKGMSRENFAVQGHVDLVKLARLLPATLRIREGTDITGGEITLACENKSGANGPQLTGNVEIKNITATNQGKVVSWNQPIVAQVAAHDSATGPVIDDLRLQSSFAAVGATGTPDAFKAQAECDLALLMSELEKFVDLGQFRVAGRGRAYVDFKRDATAGMGGQFAAQLEKFQFATPSLNLAAETAVANVTAQMTDAGIDCTQIAVSAQQVRSAGTLALDEPSAQLNAAARWESKPQKLQIANLKLQTETLSADSDNVSVQLAAAGPPVAAGTVAFRGDINRLQRLLGNPQAKYQFVGALKGQAQFDAQQTVSSAKVDATLENVAMWDVALANSPDANLRRPSWQDAQLVVKAVAGVDRSSDSLKIETLDLASEKLHVQIAGAINGLSKQQSVDITGKVDYDLEKLTPLLWPYLGKGVQLVGQDALQFAFRGPLSGGTAVNSLATSDGSGTLPGGARVTPASATTTQVPIWKTCEAQARFGWKGADLYGLQIGTAEFSGAMSKGQPQLQPIDMKIMEGRMILAPQFQLTDTAANILLPKGPILEKVRVTPELCSTGLKFVAPLVAESTQCEGTMSLDTNGATIPLADPSGADAAGHLVIHSLQVAPGSLAKTYLGFAAEIEALVRHQPSKLSEQAVLTMKEQNVEYRVANHRVYHQGLVMQAGNFTIRSSGSVGFDETLDIMIEMPIPNQLVGQDQFSAQLKGQTLQLPLRGTLSKPVVDKGSITQLTGTVLKGAAKDALGEQLNKGLDKLFKPR